MKKVKKHTVIWTVILMTAMAAGVLTGCGHSDTKDIRAAAEGMLQGWVDDDWDEISKYGTEDLLNDSKMNIFNIERSVTDFYEETGISRENLDESVQEAVTSYVDKVGKEFVESYEITEVSEDEVGVGTVRATVVLAYNPDEIDPKDNEEFNEELQQLSEDYVEEHQSEIVETYNNGGEEAVNQKSQNDLLPDIIGVYKKITASADSYTEIVDLTVEKQDDGTWLVSDYQEYTEDSASAATTN